MLVFKNWSMYLFSKFSQTLQHSLQRGLWTWTHLRGLVFSYCLLAYLRFQFPTNHICSSLPSLKITFLDRESKKEATLSCFSLLAFNMTPSAPEHGALPFLILLPALNSAQSPLSVPWHCLFKTQGNFNSVYPGYH